MSTPDPFEGISLADILEEPYKDYWQWLGKFISDFSRTEHDLNTALHQFARTENDIGRVLFSGMRVESSIDTINRLLTARGMNRAKARLKKPFEQLGEINKTRNDIVHWGASPMKRRLGESQQFVVTNARFVQKGRATLAYPVSVEIFLAMSTDLLKISFHIGAEMWRNEIPKSDYRRMFRPILRAEWQYKPPQRALPQDRSARKRQAPPPPPPASGA
jgi:hypothetical protein